MAGLSKRVGLVALVVIVQQYYVLANGATKAAAAAAAVSSSRAGVSCNCEKIYDPVCGTDGRTYSNKCILLCVSDYNVRHGYPPIDVKKRGECTRKPCKCSNLIKPVCGSDGNTYANECYFRCENTRRKLNCLPGIKITNAGFCRSNICHCSNVIIPVCSSDGRTYRNICVLQCVSYSNLLQGKRPIYWASVGVCKRENCGCPPITNPMCGSDGKSYKNRCALACWNRRLDQLGKPPIRIQYTGKCVTNCICPTVYDPVCAESLTFANRCTLACTNKRRAIMKMRPLDFTSWGACPCKCSLLYDPVCASDDITYPNRCLLRCENKRLVDLGMRQLSLVHNGRCRCNCKYCPMNYDPVCGNDGRSYWNRCWLICNRSCNSDIGRPLYSVCNGPC